MQKVWSCLRSKFFPTPSNLQMSNESPSRQRRHTIGGCGRQIVYVYVKKKRSKDLSMWDAIFQTSEPAWLAVTSGEDEASVLNKSHDHPDHVLLPQKS